MAKAPDVRVTEVKARDDALIVSGYVDAVFVTAQGWVSWTKNFWDVDVPEDPRAKTRRKMTPEEIKSYCRDLLLEASGKAGRPLPGVAALLDEAP